MFHTCLQTPVAGITFSNSAGFNVLWIVLEMNTTTYSYGLSFCSMVVWRNHTVCMMLNS